MARFEMLEALAAGKPPPSKLPAVPGNDTLNLEIGCGTYRGFAFQLPTDVMSSLMVQVKLAVMAAVENELNGEQA